ncbi:dolichyldiphosphatase [Aureococcus anophagefferens]|nr:dolichyldiphosphatase [Aureococcus anophagefferens]
MRLVLVLSCVAALRAPLPSPVRRAALRSSRGATPTTPTPAPLPMRAFEAVGESTRFAVSGAVATTLLARRDAETLLWVLGAILAAVCNKVLKRIIKEERPAEGDDGGMPSSHACSVFHLGVGAVLRFPMPPGLPAALAAYGLVSLAWRVHARYHTTAQVVVGAAFGAATAVFFRAASLRLEPALPATIPLPWILSVYGVGAVVVDL